MKVVVRKTEMDKIPENCMKCREAGCTLPVINRYPYDRIKKPYLTKRHSHCPLRWVESTELKKGGE